jgi:hypothetical protein
VRTAGESISLLYEDCNSGEGIFGTWYIGRYDSGRFALRPLADSAAAYDEIQEVVTDGALLDSLPAGYDGASPRIHCDYARPETKTTFCEKARSARQEVRSAGGAARDWPGHRHGRR